MDDHPDPLPAQRLCNRYNNPNPIQGEGALGNQAAGRMYFEGQDQRDLVERVQRMLLELGYDPGSSGPGGDGVDGSFGPATEQAVRQFQEEHQGWDGIALKADGLVGPRTADELNRQMVGRWYQHYLTPLALTESRPIHTATSDHLGRGLEIEPGSSSTGRVFLIGTPSPMNTLTIRLIDSSGEPLPGEDYRLEIEDPAFRPLEGSTDDSGILSQRIPSGATKGRLILDTIVFDLFIQDLSPPDTAEGALARLRNLGYGRSPPEVASSGQEEEPAQEGLRAALLQFQQEQELDASGELDRPTVRRMVERYGC